MKKAIASLMVGASMSAMASGPYDGLYQSVINEKSFFMVQQNGNSLLIANYFSTPTDGTIFFTFPYSVVRPQEAYIWDAFMGPVNGNTAVVTGLGAAGACNVALQVTLSLQSLSMSVLGVEQTPLGFAQGVPCHATFYRGMSVLSRRVF